MADTSAMADIRGINIDKLAKGFADEQNIFKKFVTNASTSAREIRWYQKTAGFLDTADSTGITASQISNVSFKARPFVTEQSWTRNTSYIKKYFVESPWISDEDIKDTDIDILATNVRDLVRAVQRQVDQRIINVLTENYTPSTIQTFVAEQDGWNDIQTGNPIQDLNEAKQMIRAYGYDPEGAVLAINSIENMHLLNFLISVKGSSIPSFAADKVQSGVVMNLLGLRVVVSEHVTTDYALVFVPQRAATWKSFTGISTAIVSDPGIGKKIRVWEEGECLLTDPKAVVLITDTMI
jgi:hypothetical protein